MVNLGVVAWQGRCRSTFKLIFFINEVAQILDLLAPSSPCKWITWGNGFSFSPSLHHLPSSSLNKLGIFLFWGEKFCSQKLLRTLEQVTLTPANDSPSNALTQASGGSGPRKNVWSDDESTFYSSLFLQVVIGHLLGRPTHSFFFFYFHKRMLPMLWMLSASFSLPE